MSYKAKAGLLLWCLVSGACVADPLTIIGTGPSDGGSVDVMDAAPANDVADVPQDAGLSADFDGFVFPDAHEGDGCVPLPELCNNIDDDCDGDVDEGYDKLGNALYCNGCVGCQFLVALDAIPKCDQGQCAIQSCAGGFIDFNQDISDGCELPCTPTGPEICDGKDNDCNNQVDEGLTAPTTGCLTLGPCAGAQPTCQGDQGWVCQYSADVELRSCAVDADCGGSIKCAAGFCPGVVANDESLCDGSDGDCDDVADDPWKAASFINPLGSGCSPSPATVKGACRSVGVYQCNTAKDGVSCNETQAGAAPADELCNGEDDDCDGLVDEEADDAAGLGVVDAMVRVQRTVNLIDYDFYIYAYEASRTDSTATSEGASESRSCSASGQMPWQNITYAQAAAACAVSGKRLCTGEEWWVACTGAADDVYPYGNNYGASSCNGVDEGTGGPLPTGDLVACEGGYTGLFDMSGNLREWTDDQRGTTGAGTPVYVVRGGAYHTPGPGLTCDFVLSQAVADVVLPTIGFRCCSDAAP